MEGDLWQEIRETQRLLELALSEAKRRGEVMVQAEAEYYTAKAEASFALKEQGVPVTFIQTVIKGVPEVCGPMTRYHAAQVEYENAREGRNVYKKKLDTLREQYAREWSATG